MKKNNNRKITSPQSLNAYIKGICDIMRRSGRAGALQYVPELTWMLFLRILDEREEKEAEQAKAVGADFRPSLEYPYRWRDWAAPPDNGLLKLGCGLKRKELQNSTLGAFMSFVNGDLIPSLKNLKNKPGATPRQKVISKVFSSFERTGVDTERNLLDILDKIHELSLEQVDQTHMFPISQRKLFNECNLWCIVSLPPKVFANAGAASKTNLLFFTKGEPTKQIWYYDLSDLNITKKQPLTLEHFEEFIKLLPEKATSGRSWLIPIEEIKAKNFDLKAVNPNRRGTEDNRTPEELLSIIESQTAEITKALTALRNMGI